MRRESADNASDPEAFQRGRYPAKIYSGSMPAAVRMTCSPDEDNETITISCDIICVRVRIIIYLTCKPPARCSLEFCTCSVTWPRVLIISPMRAAPSDDFPAPTCPTTATSSPRPISRLILGQHLQHTLHINEILSRRHLK